MLKSTLLQLDSTFSERSYGAGTFRDFAERLEKAGLVTLKVAGRNILVELKDDDRAARMPVVSEANENPENLENPENPENAENPENLENRQGSENMCEPCEHRSCETSRRRRRGPPSADGIPRAAFSDVRPQREAGASSGERLLR